MFIEVIIIMNLRRITKSIVRKMLFWKRKKVINKKAKIIMKITPLSKLSTKQMKTTDLFILYSYNQINIHSNWKPFRNHMEKKYNFYIIFLKFLLFYK